MTWCGTTNTRMSAPFAALTTSGLAFYNQIRVISNKTHGNLVFKQPINTWTFCWDTIGTQSSNFLVTLLLLNASCWKHVLKFPERHYFLTKKWHCPFNLYLSLSIPFYLTALLHFSPFAGLTLRFLTVRKIKLIK